MSAVAASEFVRILFLRRAKQEHQNAVVPVMETELPGGLFLLRRKMQKSTTTRCRKMRHACQIIPLLGKGFPTAVLLSLTRTPGHACAVDLNALRRTLGYLRLKALPHRCEYQR